MGNDMVRINCGVPPEHLSDQHLVAEYREILLAFGYYNKNDNKGLKPATNNLMHPIRFYHNKRQYLIKRFYKLKEEMLSRGMKPKKDITLKRVKMILYNDFNPDKEHTQRIKKRIIQRLNEKPELYRYCGEYQPPEFFEGIMNEQKK